MSSSTKYVCSILYRQSNRSIDTKGKIKIMVKADFIPVWSYQEKGGTGMLSS